MLAEVMVTGFAEDGTVYPSFIALAGSPQTVAKDIASIGGDMHAMCLSGVLKSYTLVSILLLSDGKVIVA